MEKIFSFLSPFKYYILAIMLAAYPAVWLLGDVHGKGTAHLQDAKVTIQLDKDAAADNKKAADAALKGEQVLSKDVTNLENQKNDPLPAVDDPCKPSPQRLRTLQDLVNEANK